MITITGYDEDWPKSFQEIRDCLRSELHGEGGAFEVEHFGSTAVPGLVARPVLDLCVVVPEASTLPALIGGLDRLGYVYERDQGVPGAGDLPSKGARCAVSRAQEGLLAASSVRFGLGLCGN
jgi:GrpB-like predicted nucleotidyltransferase (UPF0157 family)